MDEELHIGRRIRNARKERGLTIRQLAERSGMSLNGVHLIETGQRAPSFESVTKLARGLNVEPSVLLEVPKVQAPPESYEELLSRAGALGSGLERPTDYWVEGNVAELFEGLDHEEALRLYKDLVEARLTVYGWVDDYLRTHPNLSPSDKARLEGLRAKTMWRTQIAFGSAWMLLDEDIKEAQERGDHETAHRLMKRQYEMSVAG